MAIDRALIEGARKQIAHEVATLPQVLSTVYADRNYVLVGFNVDLIGRSLLLRGMIAQRVDHDAAAAIADFAAASRNTQEFEKALAAIRSGSPPGPIGGDLDIASFEIPLFACVLSGMWNRAREVALLTRDPHVRDREDPVKALVTRLLAALILDDEVEFRQLRTKYDRAKKIRWWQSLAIYVDMYEAVLNRSSTRYHELAAQADAQFRARAKDKKVGTLRPEYGGLEYNELVLDFIALSIADIARWRGVVLPPDSDTVPHVLVEAAARNAP